MAISLGKDRSHMTTDMAVTRTNVKCLTVEVKDMESSWTMSKKKCWLNLLNFGCHLLQHSLLGNV
jgi:hypothetical protein